jgi:hypothetical protein
MIDDYFRHELIVCESMFLKAEEKELIFPAFVFVNL